MNRKAKRREGTVCQLYVCTEYGPGVSVTNVIELGIRDGGKTVQNKTGNTETWMGHRCAPASQLSVTDWLTERETGQVAS